MAHPAAWKERFHEVTPSPPSAMIELQALRNVVRNRRDQIKFIRDDAEEYCNASRSKLSQWEAQISAFNTVLEDINRQINALLEAV